MSNGLPSLLDAIFGKQDLSLVSLEDIYEVIREFPSFNAGHFLLAKKLKLQDDPAYDKESMRTALYFNNPFWLQSLLDDGNHFQPAVSYSQVMETEKKELFTADEFEEETTVVTDADSDYTILEESNYTFESYTPVEKPIAAEDELDQEVEEILDEKPASYTMQPEDTFQYAEPGSQTVTSFDELMAKYHIQPLEMVDETPVEIPTQTKVETEEDVKSEAVTESGSDLSNVSETSHSENKNVQVKPEAIQDFLFPDAESNKENKTTVDRDQNGSLKEVVNEYGIFEEIVVNKTDHDHDLDAFDRPFDQIPFVSERLYEETVPAGKTFNTENIVTPEDTAGAEEIKIAETSVVNDNENISESQETADSPDKTDEHDYDAFDGRVEENEQIEPSVQENGNSDEMSDYDPDNTGESVEYRDDSESGANVEMQELSQRFEEQQKVLSTFNAKNADSIVFTPYHMVDYFASQGIKLVLEDNPPDQFGKQLKSFTDWLKVMKKLPVQASGGKAYEKEAEQIRHFAAHSIEERDILTESMAEVLAKQGMYENAIALFQKLSLIYPPKSAYFASRIEQLKASLP
jgi:hypothetical protein